MTETTPCTSCGTTERFGHHPDCEYGPSPCGRYGWSITVGELRAAIENVPDDYEVMLTNAEVDDIEIANVNIESLYPPFEGASGLLVLGGGQILNYEYAYDERMDRGHDGTDIVRRYQRYGAERWFERHAPFFNPNDNEVG